MRAWIGDDDQNDPWQQVTRHWLARLRASLGGTYIIAESAQFLLLSVLDGKAREQMLGFLEKGRARLLHTLGDVGWARTTGKHVVLRFSEMDDYFAYISHFCPDGEHAASGGVFLREGFCHIAYPETYTMEAERQTLAHELAHNLLAHLPLPLWLNEALAEAFATDLAGGQFASVDADLLAEHRSYWNAQTIQDFWMGKSFQAVDGQRVSYSLAQVLQDVINRELKPPPETFRRFVKQCDWTDAGEAAAREQLEVSLGEIAEVFLGPGDWTPKPEVWKTMRES